MIWLMIFGSTIFNSTFCNGKRLIVRTMQATLVLTESFKYANGAIFAN
jgi:hypothetical protein